MTKFLNTDLDTTLGGSTPSDQKVSSQKAIKTYIDTEVSSKQDTLVSGTNIKTINNTSLLGSGNITIDGLPDQTNQSGKILTTNGTSASWADYIQVSSMPTAASTNEGRIVQYIGNTNASYTNGYFYKSTSSIQDATVSFTGNKIRVSFSDFEIFVEAHRPEVNQNDGPVVRGTMKIYNSGGSSDPLWVFSGKNEYGIGVSSYNGQQSQFVAAGFSFHNTSTLNNGDVLDFEVTNITTAYSWVRIDVQPTSGSSLPSQAGNSGKFLTTNGTDPSWADLPTEIPSQAGNSGKFLKTDGTAVSWARGVENLSLQTDGLTVFGTPSDTGSGTINIGPGTSSIYGGIAIGLNAQAVGNRGVAIAEATSAASTAVAIGYNAKATATNAVQLGAGTNANTGTLQFKSYQLLDTNGMIPEARLASTGSAVQGQALVLDSGLDAKWTTLKVSDLTDDSDFATVTFRAWGAGE